MRKSFLSLGAALMALTVFLSGCGGTKPAEQTPGAEPPSQETKELVIYTGRRENLVQPVIDAFEQQTGIKVSLVAGSATEMATRVLEEKSNPKGDIYISNDAGSLEKLRAEKVVEAYTSPNLAKVPADLKAPDNTWHAVTVRTRVIMYNKDLVSESELPKSLFDLTDPTWKDQIGMATGANESVIANVTALRLSEGEEQTEQFLTNLVANGIKVYKGHGDVRQAVGKGEIKLGWVNHYYVHQQLAEKENNNVGIIYPDQDGAGRDR